MEPGRWTNLQWHLEGNVLVHSCARYENSYDIRMHSLTSVGIPTARPSASLTTPIPTAGPTGVQTPSPNHEGMVTNCNKFHFVVTDENCNTLVQKYGTFTLAQFLSWNLSVGSGCEGLGLETYFCVGVPGNTPPTTTKPSTTLATSTRPASSTWSMPCILQFFNGQYLCTGK
jgi:hypothetical protein